MAVQAFSVVEMKGRNKRAQNSALKATEEACFHKEMILHVDFVADMKAGAFTVAMEQPHRGFLYTFLVSAFCGCHF